MNKEYITKLNDLKLNVEAKVKEINIIYDRLDTEKQFSKDWVRDTNYLQESLGEHLDLLKELSALETIIK